MEPLEPAFAYGLAALAALVGVTLIIWRLGRGSSVTRPAPTRPASTTPVASDSPVRAAAIRARAPAATRPPPSKPQVLALTSDEHYTLLSEALTATCVRVNSATELSSKAALLSAAVFVDVERLPTLKGDLARLPIVLIVDAPPAKTRSTIVELLAEHPSIGHVVAGPLLSTPLGRTHLHNLVERLAAGSEHDLLDTASVGRVAMLAQASRRDARFERMQTYFSNQGMSPRIIAAIYEVAEELVMNALYNAPTEAGYFKTPVSRTEDVTLPMDRACEISYGIEAGHAFVRLRDTFGSLRRQRLFEVLGRCNKDAVSLDESRGGAGLGIWRVFTVATTIAITVIPGRLTDILIRMMPKNSKAPKQLLAVDLYFLADSDEASDVLVVEPDSALVDHSVTMIQN